MHPHINNWGSLLRLYGSRSIKTPREKKIEEQEITTLQNRAAANQPNWAILEKLKGAMLKLEQSRVRSCYLLGFCNMFTWIIKNNFLQEYF